MFVYILIKWRPEKQHLRSHCWPWSQMGVITDGSDKMGVTGSWSVFERERKTLEVKLKKRMEIWWLQLELQCTSMSQHSSECQTEHEESTWKDSVYEEESQSVPCEYEPITSKRRCPTLSEGEDRRVVMLATWHGDQRISQNFSKTVIYEYFICSQSVVEIPMKSPLSEGIESTIIDRHLKIP